MAKVLLLNSGGLDSALVGKFLKRDGHEVHSLHLDTGQLNRVRAMAAAATTATKYCASHRVMTLDYGQPTNYWEVPLDEPNLMGLPLGTGTLAPGAVTMYASVPDPVAEDAKHPPYHLQSLPNTAMLLLGLGVSYAKVLGIQNVYSGFRVNVTNTFAANYDEMSDQNLWRLSRPRVKFPLAPYYTYREAIEVGGGVTMTPAKWTALRAELAYTHSCHRPVPCGTCPKCTGRAEVGL